MTKNTERGENVSQSEYGPCRTETGAPVYLIHMHTCVVCGAEKLCEDMIVLDGPRCDGCDRRERNDVGMMPTRSRVLSDIADDVASSFPLQALMLRNMAQSLYRDDAGHVLVNRRTMTINGEEVEGNQPSRGRSRCQPRHVGGRSTQVGQMGRTRLGRKDQQVKKSLIIGAVGVVSLATLVGLSSSKSDGRQLATVAGLTPPASVVELPMPTVAEITTTTVAPEPTPLVQEPTTTTSAPEVAPTTTTVRSEPRVEPPVESPVKEVAPEPTTTTTTQRPSGHLDASPSVWVRDRHGYCMETDRASMEAQGLTEDSSCPSNEPAVVTGDKEGGPDAR
jgi:hypothetical protein